MNSIEYNKLRHGDILSKGGNSGMYTDKGYTLVLDVEGEWHHVHIGVSESRTEAHTAQWTHNPSVWFVGAHDAVVGNMFDAFARAIDTEVDSD